MADAKTKQYDRFRASKEVLKEVRKTAAGNLTSKLKVIGIRPMAPVLNKVHLRVSEHEMLSFSVRKEIIKK